MEKNRVAAKVGKRETSTPITESASWVIPTSAKRNAPSVRKRGRATASRYRSAHRDAGDLRRLPAQAGPGGGSTAYGPTNRCGKREKSKSKIQNPKQIQNPNSEENKRFGIFVFFLDSDLFRISISVFSFGAQRGRRCSSPAGGLEQRIGPLSFPRLPAAAPETRNSRSCGHSATRRKPCPRALED